MLAVHLETTPAPVSLMETLRPLQNALTTRPRGELKRELMQKQRRLT